MHTCFSVLFILPLFFPTCSFLFLRFSSVELDVMGDGSWRSAPVKDLVGGEMYGRVVERRGSVGFGEKNSGKAK